MITLTGLWIGKTGNANAWYHIYPFAASRLSNKMHVVRYQKPQKNITTGEISYHTFSSKGIISEFFHYLINGFKVLKNNEIDYIVSFNLVPWGSISWFLAKIFNKPIIIGLIGTDYNRYINNNNKSIYKYILRNTDVITVTGSNMKHDLISQQIGSDNIFIYPHCLDDKYFQSDYTEVSSEFEIISISHLNKNKRIIDIIKAIKILEERGLRISLGILGEGPEEKLLKEEVKKLELEHHVNFFGYQIDTIAYLKRAKIFVQASLKEGLSLSLIEAMGMGLVPIITEAGSERDLIIDNENGLFINKVDPIDLADKIEYALNPSNYSRIKQNVLCTREKFRVINAVRVSDQIQRYLKQKAMIGRK